MARLRFARAAVEDGEGGRYGLVWDRRTAG